MRRLLLLTLALPVLLGTGALNAHAASPHFVTVKLAGAAQTTEPRVTVTPDNRRWVVTNDAQTGAEIVYGSSDSGLTWRRTPSDPTQGPLASIDVDIVSTHTGRLISSELDFAAISFYTAYSDDGGSSWTQSSGGSQLADTDREWLAVGPDDPQTHQPTVYLLFHNLASGTITHNMWVTKSVDGGATFGEPVPVTLPPSQAWQDLQCADSGGPSSIAVNRWTGDVYVVFGTRTAPLGGGCGSSVFGPFEVNVVAATRIWVAHLPGGKDNLPGNWQDVLAHDGNGHIVGMQLSPGALDNQGNLYIAFTESPNQYPDYSGAALRYVWASPALALFSTPTTVVPGGKAGTVLPHVIAGDPGKLDFSYYQGVARSGGLRPAWYESAAQTLTGRSTKPSFATQQISKTVAYTGTASELMGACAEMGPAQGIENGFACGRSTDVWGIALDALCRVTITWPTRDNIGYANDAGDQAFAATPNDPGTFVSTQTGGPAVCGR